MDWLKDFWAPTKSEFWIFNAYNEENKNNFPNNHIKTSRYNFVTFLPLFLIDQFKKTANVYFLVISLLQQIPGVSPMGKYITISVLFGILGILAIKEIIEDIKRHYSDSKVNNQPCEVFNSRWIRKTWKNIYVGDIIKVYSDQIVPTDIILLATSESNQKCYIQTSSLDGEINYKIKHCKPACIKFSNEQHWASESVSVKCDPPNKNLYNFNGVMRNIASEDVSINNDQVVLRGCHVKNTSWIVGLVVYTGHQTKIMMNSSSTVIKRSSVDVKTNKFSFILLSIIAFLTLLSTIICEIVYRRVLPGHLYIKYVNTSSSFIYTIITFLILYHNFIPVSLIATVEVVKAFQGYIINKDRLMYTRYPPSHEIVNTCSVIEDLGHVNYIFSDKTGTLTSNEMVLKSLSIDGVHYNLDESFIVHIQKEEIKNNPNVKLFFVNLLLCNSILVEEGIDKNFQSSSPDEIAIVAALNQKGIKFVSREINGIHIDYLGEPEFWKIILTFDYSSERQRMSVLVTSPSHKHYLFMKGSDESIKKRLKSIDTDIYYTTTIQCSSFANDGMRTLWVAYKELSIEEANQTFINFNRVMSTLENRDKFMSEASEKLEKTLYLLGCTGVEDKLQENVSQTITSLREAKVKIWMLTGDKLETAINIARSTRLLDDSMTLYTLNFEDIVECLNNLREIQNSLHIESATGKTLNNVKHPRNIAIVVTGKDLIQIISTKCSMPFLNLAIHCKSVICCRLSPAQKQDILMLVKSKVRNAVTLAIGDGANDCSMIRASHVGVGIVGKEGFHAANTADFAIDEFQLLTRLLFVHGAACYRRTCNCVYFTFYKNLVLNLMPFYYNYITLFSGKSLINKIHFPFFNGIYTSLHPFCFGLLDLVSSPEAAVNIPYLYESLRKNYKFCYKRFLYWCLNATQHSIFIFVFVYISLSHGTFGYYGAPLSDTVFQTIILANAIVVISLKSELEIRNWSYLSQFGIWIGFICYMLCLIVFSRSFLKIFFFKPENYDIDAQLIFSPVFYISLFIPFIVLLPDLLFYCVRNTYFIPTHMLITGLEKNNINIWSAADAIDTVKIEIQKSSSTKNKRSHALLRTIKEFQD